MRLTAEQARATAQHHAGCACYVAELPDEERFCLRYGAHEPSCPVYRPSADPVDRGHDADARDYYRRRQIIDLLLERERQGAHQLYLDALVDDRRTVRELLREIREHQKGAK